MGSKKELQSLLKDQYGINKNISNAFNLQQCEQLIELLEQEQTVRLLTESFASKNGELRNNNRRYGQERSRAENKLNSLQANYQELEKSIQSLELSNQTLEARKQDLEIEKQELESERTKLEAEIQSLSVNNRDNLAAEKKKLEAEREKLEKDLQALSLNNQNLNKKVDQLNSKNKELSGANQRLMKDNKDLKNIVDAIRLRLAQNIDKLLEYEDSQIRKALVRLLKWTVG